MITTDAQLRRNLELMSSMYEAIAELRRRIAPRNRNNYLILSEGPLEQIRRLQHEVEEYLEIKSATGESRQSVIGEQVSSAANSNFTSEV